MNLFIFTSLDYGMLRCGRYINFFLSFGFKILLADNEQAAVKVVIKNDY